MLTGRCTSRTKGNDRSQGWLKITALTLCTLSLLAIFLTGFVGYFVVDRFWSAFYYAPIKDGKNVWLFRQLACMVLYAAGVFLAFSGIYRTSHAIPSWA